MTNEDILKRLYELRIMTPKQQADYINAWIGEIKCAMAEESAMSVGLGNAVKSIKELLKMSAKCNDIYGRMLKSSNGRYIITNNKFIIALPGDFGLNSSDNYRDIADYAVHVISCVKHKCTKAVRAPYRSDIDALIKDYKTTPKAIRPNKALYNDKYDAAILLRMLAVFPLPVMYVDPDNTDSPLYFARGLYEGVIMPQSPEN